MLAAVTPSIPTMAPDGMCTTRPERSAVFFMRFRQRADELFCGSFSDVVDPAEGGLSSLPAVDSFRQDRADGPAADESDFEHPGFFYGGF